MLVKRYIVKDMQEAMSTVIKELGADAVILNSRKVRQKGFWGLFKKKLVEVMAAYDPAKIPTARKYTDYRTPPEQRTEPKPGAEKVEKAERDEKAEKTETGISTEQIEKLEGRIDSLDSILRDFTERFSIVKRDITYDYPDEIAELFCAMVENQVRDELAHSIAKQTDLILKKQTEASAYEVMQHLIMEHLGNPDPITHKKFTRKTVLVMGPTGAGKTTTIVKLAANFAMKQKKKVGIINTDTYRIGAQEQLQTYADILGIPIQVVYETDELTAAFEGMSDRDIVFIDTAGKSPGDSQHKDDILKIIRTSQPEDILLCLSASTSFAAAREVLDTYSFVERYKLLVTKLDETRYRGMILNLSWYTQSPLAYVTTGQNVPDDIELADAAAIASQILGFRPGIGVGGVSGY